MAPKDVHVLILETCEYVTLLGKRDFVGVTKLRILWWEDYPGLSRWTQCEHKYSSKGTRETGVSENGRLQEQRSCGAYYSAIKKRKFCR